MHKVRLLRYIHIQQLRSLIEELRMLVHTRRFDAFRILIHYFS
jgi:hypothetical protein